MPQFTTDWFTPNIPDWERILKLLQDRPVNILEIGSYEGRSALFLLEFLPHSRITCVDTFVDRAADEPGYEQRFDANTALLGHRVRKIKGRSVPALDALACAGERFDVIYIDGDHGRYSVLLDSILAWPLLKTEGVLIWDDYIWERDALPPDLRPEQAIDLFLAMFGPCLTELQRGYQVIVRKCAEWPQPAAPGETRLAGLQRGLGELEAEVVATKERLPNLGKVLSYFGSQQPFNVWHWLRRRVTPPKRFRMAARRWLRIR